MRSLIKFFCSNGHFVRLTEGNGLKMRYPPKACRICHSHELIAIEDSNSSFWALEQIGLQTVRRYVRGAVNAKGKPIRAFRMINVPVFDVSILNQGR